PLTCCPASWGASARSPRTGCCGWWTRPGPERPGWGVMDLRAAAQLLFPFFSASPGHARALVEAAFARVGGDVEALYLVVAGDAPLCALLREAGAEVRHEILELRGTLPGA
ncbi:GNAT family N-acetyltransferase, partial [Pyxidicoccus sp. 3LG]